MRAKSKVRIQCASFHDRRTPEQRRHSDSLAQKLYDWLVDRNVQRRTAIKKLCCPPEVVGMLRHQAD